MVYGRFGGEIEIVREGTLADVRKLDGRKPDKQDRDAIELGSYVIWRHAGDGPGGQEHLAHVAYLRADDGFKEIVDAMRAAGIRNRMTHPDN